MKLRITAALAAIVLIVACGSSDTSSNLTAQKEPISQEDAKRLYKKKCGLCHGADGKKMLAGASDLSRSTFNHEERVAIITYGKRKMTPFQNTLSAEEIDAVATYIATLVEE